MITKRIFLSILILLLTLPLASRLHSDRARDIAIMLKVKSKVEVAKNNSDDWQQARRGTRLNSGDRIRTGSDAIATIIFTDDKSLLKIRADSEVALHGEREQRTIKKRLTMEVGEMWAKISKGGSGFRMETPSGVAAVKGTEWYGVVLGDGSAMFVVMEGLLELVNELGKKLIEEGYTGTMTQTSAPQAQQTGAFDEWAGDEDVEELQKSLEIEFQDADGQKKTLKIDYQEPQEQE